MTEYLSYGCNWRDQPKVDGHGIRGHYFLSSSIDINISAIPVFLRLGSLVKDEMQAASKEQQDAGQIACAPKTPALFGIFGASHFPCRKAFR